MNLLEQVHQQAKVNIFTNWPNLNAVGVEPSTPANLSGMQGVPASTALEIVLKQIGTDPTNPVRFAVREGVVLVDTAQGLSSTKDTRVYDVRDLVAVSAPRKRDRPAADSESEMMGGDSGSACFGDEVTLDLQAEAVQAKVDQLVTVIQTAVGEPENWQEGGGVDAIRELNGNLVVRTTPENHREIERLLGDLRKQSRKR
jgi:hypothetical protein